MTDRRCPRLLLLCLLLLLGVAEGARAQEDGVSRGDSIVRGSLEELKNLRRVALVVTRSPVIDVQDTGQSLIAEAYKAESGLRRRHVYPHATIARRLNEYIRKYQSMTAVDRLAEADYIIFFNLLEYRRALNGTYPYGELFIILQKGAGPSHQPRIVWKAEKVMWADDAVKQFIKSLKRVRGEK